MPKYKNVTRYSRYYDVADRLKQSVKIDDNGCWIWQKKIQNNGYAASYYIVNGKKVDTSGHRLSYMTFNGSIPKDLTIDHLCRVRSCINPKHLEAVTQQENMRRAKCLITQCAQGHAYSPENTYIKPNGNRNCRQCIRDRVKVYERNKRAKSTTP